MAEDAPVKGGLDFLKTKIGPVPIAVYGVVFLGLFYYLQHKKSATTGQQIDSAGNVGSIDPATGYVYGSQQDRTALASSGAAGSGSSDTSGAGAGSGATVAGQYATNADWGRAAINYLVALGIDPTTANQAIQQYLSSQTLTTDQQGDVNLAIQSLGAPPTLPSPASVNPTPIVTPGSGQTNASNPPTGLTAGSPTTVSVTLKWNAASNATGYTVQYGTNQGSYPQSTTATTPSITIGGLSPGTTYYFQVQATPASSGAGWAGPVSATTTAPAPTPGPAPSPTPGPAPAPAARRYTIVSGDTLTGIALKEYGAASRWTGIFSANQSTLDAAARQHGRPDSGGGHWIYPGTVITIP